jgi:hypothetical protein
MNNTGLIALIVIFASCTKEVSIDIVNPESKIVVNSFFSPQDSLFVHISKSISILADDTLNYFNNAEVKLYNGLSFLGQLTNNQKGIYTFSSTLVPNGQYSINVSVPGIEPVSSFDTIPVQIPILSFDTISVNDEYLYCEIKFQDIPCNNYYLLDITSKYPVLNSDKIMSKQIDITVSDNIVENGRNGAISKRIFFSDDKIQGMEYELTFLLGKKPLMQSITNGSNTLYINFKTISIAYYKYLKTYYEAETKLIDVYSNVVNGYGIFAGYYLSQDSIVIQ